MASCATKRAGCQISHSLKAAQISQSNDVSDKYDPPTLSTRTSTTSAAQVYGAKWLTMHPHTRSRSAYGRQVNQFETSTIRT
jgi:hypothetical protein